MYPTCVYIYIYTCSLYRCIYYIYIDHYFTYIYIILYIILYYPYAPCMEYLINLGDYWDKCWNILHRASRLHCSCQATHASSSVSKAHQNLQWLSSQSSALGASGKSNKSMCSIPNCGEFCLYIYIHIMYICCTIHIYIYTYRYRYIIYIYIICKYG